MSNLLSRAAAGASAAARRGARLGAASVFGSVAAAATRRRRVLTVGVALLVAGALLLALGLDGSAGPEQVSGGARSAPTRELHKQFGEEPILVLVKARRDEGQLPALLLTEDLGRMLGLEGCLSGNLPRGAKAPAPACAELARRKPIQVVYGPGTFINESARQIAARFRRERAKARREADKAEEAARKVAAAQGRSPQEQERLARQARDLVFGQSFSDALGLALRYGLSRVPQLNDPDFVLKLVFEPSLGFATPKPRFAYLFPTNESALIQARLRPGLSESERRRAVTLVREATASKPFKLERGTYLVAGPPVVEDAVADAVPGAIWAPLGAAAGLVALLLVLAARSPRGLLALLPALAATALAYGALALFGGSLTLAALAIGPFVIGFGAGATVLLRWAFADLAARAAPAATALAASVLALLALLVSPVPMMRTFGGLVALGVGLSILLAFALAPLAIGARWHEPETATGGRTARRPLSALAWRRSRLVLGAALALALTGWVLSSQTDVSASIERLASTDTAEVQAARTLERETGYAGNVSVLVNSNRLTSPAVLKWMSGYERRILARHGYRDDRLCRRAEICPGLSLTGLIGAARTPAEVNRALDRLPSYFSQAVISADGRTANLAFRIQDIPLDKRRELIADMRDQLDAPPGVSASIAGLPAAAADAGSELRSSWLALAAVGLALILVLLLAAGWRGGQALPALLPAALATGWSGLVLFPADLNPLSASFAAPIIAALAAFGIIVSAGDRARRRAGADGLTAIEQVYGGSGRTLATAGAASIAALAALAFADPPMLHDLWPVAALDLLLVFVVAACVLPATLAWQEGRTPLRLPRSRAELAAIARRTGSTMHAGWMRGVARARALAARLRRRREAGSSVEP
jgi:predicted RND superfamily exporter protein